MKKEKRKSQIGFILLFTLLISSILLATGLGISRLMVRQIGLASLGRESQVAFFAADSGLACAIYWNKHNKFDLPDPLDPLAALESRTIYCNGAAIENGKPSVIKGATGSACDALGAPPLNNIIGEEVDGDVKSCFTFSASSASSLGDGPSAQIIDFKQPCVFIVVAKKKKTADITLPSLTTITANGYNKCDLSLPNVLQRTLEVEAI